MCRMIQTSYRPRTVNDTKMKYSRIRVVLAKQGNEWWEFGKKLKWRKHTETKKRNLMNGTERLMGGVKHMYGNVGYRQL